MVGPTSDPQIKDAVLNELRWDQRIEEREVGVQVDRGVVTLSGTVSSWGRKHAAEEAAHRVAGVLDVANDIEVRMTHGAAERSDTDIARAVRHTLDWDVFVPAERIRSTVSEGWVTLEGEVNSLAQRQDALRAVRNLAGVRAVVDKIHVSPPHADEDELRKHIEQALERWADREAQRIQVQVKGSCASLSATVRSSAERQVVLGAARGTVGIAQIEDHLRVDPGSG